MRILILLLSTLIFNVYLYPQNNNNQNTNQNNNTNENGNPNALMLINKFDAMKNPVSFINIVNFTPYNLLLEYARVNGIEIYPYDSEADLRARIIKRQVNVKVERVKGEA